ncbi:MAG TPA: cardiolipin synthase, partial [Rubrivivax sp.]|nr:cardiolipin synthase [Rubrivivax sp.]
LTLTLGLLLSSCASLPARTGAAPPATAADAKALAQSVDVTGSRGRRLTAAQREQALQRIAAQGKPTLVQHHLAVMAAAGDVDLYAGNDVKLLVDGPAAFTAMFAAAEAARDYILLESYIIEESSVAERLAEVLLRKRAQGVQVHVIYDSVGSFGTSQQYFNRLTQAGVGVCAFNPINPLRRPGYWNINHRDHRKVLVVDGLQAFMGGINVSEVYSSGSFSGRRGSRDRTKEGWRDTQIGLRGPAVAPLEKLFRQTWASQGCTPQLQQGVQRQSPSAGDKVVRVIPSGPDEPESQIYSTLLSAIDAAQISVHLTMAYFAPGPDMVAALCDAARRGVDVTLILPSISDFGLILEAGRSYYSELLAAGVKVHELQDAMLHAKTAVIDGVFSTVGSSNLDWRSFVANSEVNAIVIGEDFGAEMEAMFKRDLSVSTPITLQTWKERPLHRRLKEWMARVFERWL